MVDGDGFWWEGKGYEDEDEVAGRVVAWGLALKAIKGYPLVLYKR